VDVSKTYDLQDLLQVMKRLRDPEDGCSWDLKQSFQSIVPSTLEEAYEVAEAIEREDYKHLSEELGDLLFQVIFYCQLGEEQSRFNFDQVVSGLASKLIRRHPHVFPDGSLQSRAQSGHESSDGLIKQQWESLKEQERAAKGQSSTLADIPLNLPALSRAQKIQKRASSVGFDWDRMDEVVAKAEEELAELKEALALKRSQDVAEELGDLMFAVVNIARHCKQDAESLLRAGNRKFERRFGHIESRLAEKGSSPKLSTLAEMESLWLEAKAIEKRS
jgi:ATP diphosphatase